MVQRRGSEIIRKLVRRHSLSKVTKGSVLFPKLLDEVLHRNDFDELPENLRVEKVTAGISVRRWLPCAGGAQ